MNDETYTEEGIELPELSEADKADLALLNEEAEPHRTILEVWNEILAGGHKVAAERVQPAWASRIISMYPQIKFQEMQVFHDLYFAKLAELHEILKVEIDGDELCLKHITVDEDRDLNAAHYLNLVINWQSAILLWELSWNCIDPLSHVELAAMSEAHKFFFDPSGGLLQHLGEINFVFTEEDQQILTAHLDEIKNGDHE